MIRLELSLRTAIRRWAAGYLCIDFEGEPAYDTIDGAWKTKEPYAVVRRMAFDRAFRGRGLADATFFRIEALCRDRGVKRRTIQK